MTVDIDELVDAITLDAAVSSGVSPEVLAARGFEVAKVANGYRKGIDRSATRWTPAEESFVRSQIGKKTDEEIGSDLGRTAVAIKIRRQRRGMPAHSKRPGWLTGHQACRLLGLDIHAVMALTQRGLLPYEILPGERGILQIRKQTLMRWALNPENWIYFKQEKTRGKLRRLLDKQAERWPDEWWTSGQVARWHDVSSNAVNKSVLQGRIPARRWGNWWIKRSDAMQACFYKGKGRPGGPHEMDWSEEGDAFILAARAVGLTERMISAMMGSFYEHRRVAYRLLRMKKWADVEYVIDKYGLPVMYDADQDLLFADWRDFPGRFRRLEGALDRFRRWVAGEQRSLGSSSMYSQNLDLLMVRGVLHAWASWFALDPWQKPVVQQVAFAQQAQAEQLKAVLEELQGWGLEPI